MGLADGGEPLGQGRTQNLTCEVACFIKGWIAEIVFNDPAGPQIC